jgi:hypothetical protein
LINISQGKNKKESDMGVYDIFGELGIQMKLCNDGMSMNFYKVGDKVPLDDGIYVGYGGAIVVKGGIFIAEFPHLINKWGGIIKCEDVISGDNPIGNILKEKEGT